MADPTTTARTTPTGIPLEDGFSTKIAFAANAGILFWEKDVQPPGLDGGEPVETTTMFNTLVRTKAPGSPLIEVGDAVSTVAYDPRVYDEIMALINVRGAITVTFPNGDVYDFWGHLRSFVPDALAEKKHPTAKITIVVDNVDSSQAEAAPVMTPSGGTGS